MAPTASIAHKLRLEGGGWSSSGLLTGHDPIRKPGKKVFKTSRVGSGRVGSSRIGSGRAGSGQRRYLHRLGQVTLTRPDRRGLTPNQPVNNPDMKRKESHARQTRGQLCTTIAARARTITGDHSK